MRRMRTWLGPPFRGEGLIGNSTVRRFTDGAGGEHTERQLPEDVIPAGVVELRVHGVNGGTPEQNLHDPSPVRIAGDGTAGFYRRREELALRAWSPTMPGWPPATTIDRRNLRVAR